MAEATATRSVTQMWLIGPATEKIHGMKLPTCRQVLSVFFITTKFSVRQSETVHGV